MRTKTLVLSGLLSLSTLIPLGGVKAQAGSPLSGPLLAYICSDLSGYAEPQIGFLTPAQASDVVHEMMSFGPTILTDRVYTDSTTDAVSFECILEKIDFEITKYPRSVHHEIIFSIDARIFDYIR